MNRTHIKALVRVGGKGVPGLGVELFKLDDEEVELEETEVEAIEETVEEEQVEPEQIDKSSTALIRIYESIGLDWFDGSGISAKKFAADLDGLGDIRRLNIHINSLGGDVHTAQAMYSIIKDFECFKKTSYIDGVAASAATVVACAADEVIARRNTNYMIHNCWACCIGNADQMRKAAEDLDKITIPIVSVYHEQVKGKVSDERIKELMARETWLTADEAFNYGFIDRIRGKINPLAKVDKYNMEANGQVMNFAKYHFFNFPNYPFTDKESSTQTRKASTEVPLDKKKEQPPTQTGKLTMEEIREKDPDLLSTIQLDARQSERKRLSDLEAMMAPGLEQLITAAKADGRDASDIAVEANRLLVKQINQQQRVNQLRTDGNAISQVKAGDAPIVKTTNKIEKGTQLLVGAFNRAATRRQLRNNNGRS